MLVGKGRIQSSGFVFKPEVRNLEREEPVFNLVRGELTAEQRVQAFRVTASFPNGTEISRVISFCSCD